jgi:hypothetical protein
MYEYTITHEWEIELIRLLTDIIFEGEDIAFTISENQLRKIKIGALNGIMYYNTMVEIIYHSIINSDVSEILSRMLSKEISDSYEFD